MIKRVIIPCIAVLSLVLLIAACGGDSDDDNGNGNGLEEPSVAFSDGCQKSDEKQFPDGPETIIDTDKKYVATITMENGGEIVLELFSETPITTNNFVFLACKGFYDGVTFHRVLPGFVAQGGDPTGTGMGGAGYTIPDENDGDHTFEAGVVSMAKSSNLGQTVPDSARSQFFITYTPQPGLETDFTVFARVTSGMDFVDQLTPRDPAVDSDAPPGDVIETITIAEG